MDVYRQADNRFVIYRPAEKLNNASRSLKRSEYTIKDWQALKKELKEKGSSLIILSFAGLLFLFLIEQIFKLEYPYNFFFSFSLLCATWKKYYGLFMHLLIFNLWASCAVKEL